MDKLKEVITGRLIANTKVYDGRIEIPKTYGYLEHKPTRWTWSCYRPIGWFKRLMLNWCFGLKYIKSNG